MATFVLGSNTHGTLQAGGGGFRRLAACHRRPPNCDTAFRRSSPSLCNVFGSQPLRGTLWSVKRSLGEPLWLSKGALETFLRHVENSENRCSTSTRATMVKNKFLCNVQFSQGIRRSTSTRAMMSKNMFFCNFRFGSERSPQGSRAS